MARSTNPPSTLTPVAVPCRFSAAMTHELEVMLVLKTTVESPVAPAVGLTPW